MLKFKDGSIHFPEWVNLSTCKTRSYTVVDETPHGVVVTRLTAPSELEWFEAVLISQESDW